MNALPVSPLYPTLLYPKQSPPLIHNQVSKDNGLLESKVKEHRFVQKQQEMPRLHHRAVILQQGLSLARLAGIDLLA